MDKVRYAVTEDPKEYIYIYESYTQKVIGYKLK